MKKTALIIAAVVVAAVAAAAVWWFTSTDIDDPVEVTAPTLPPDTTPETTAPATATTLASSNSTEVPDTTAVPDTTVAIAAGPVTFELMDASLVTFEIDEVLNGSDKRVVATNPEVAAQIRVDPSDLASAEIGTVVIGAQTFETDSNNRNRAIRGPILDSNDFPTIQFVPTAVEGLSGAAAVGDLLEFTITGDLTIRDITQPVTFTVSAALTDAATIEGTAEATVSRDAFGLTIPSVAAVASVEDEVLLKIDFVAGAVG
ncbi:MAG: YceI family protein [Acidimicrobiia bacterium]|nr:YceI family protein [Acidimicrobiia bacterium]